MIPGAGWSRCLKGGPNDNAESIQARAVVVQCLPLTDSPWSIEPIQASESEILFDHQMRTLWL